MRNLKWAALAALVILAAVALRAVMPAAEVATGYSAKQLCSGVYVAGLPVDMVIEQDIHLAMGILGPLLPQLRVTLDEAGRAADASLFGVRSRALYHPGHGCVLNPMGPLHPVPALDPVAVDALPSRPEPALAPVLDAAFAEPADAARNTLAVLVLKDGAVVAERYRAPVDAETPLQGWSMNKSLNASWTGLQVERGELALEQSVRDTLALDYPQLADGVSPRLQLSHLLHMESGFDFLETYAPGDDATLMLFRSPAAWQVAPGVGYSAEPGERFSYSSGDTNLAAWLWQQSIDGADYAAWLRENFYGPLGIASAVSEHDAAGYQVGSSFSYMTARDWARLGQFWLDAWHGRSELLSQQWQRAATRPRPSASMGEYGRGFWLNAKGHAFPTLPRNLFYASGHSGQFVVVFPEQELVVVRLGLSAEGASGLSALLEGVYAELQAP